MFVRLFFGALITLSSIVGLILAAPNTTQLVSTKNPLKELEWMIGTWQDVDDKVSIDMVANWDLSQNFIMQEYTIKQGERVEIVIKQIIGWDPIKKAIRSWVFDSDGGFGESVWSHKGDSWIVHQAFTLSNGWRASAINTYAQVTDSNYIWESTGREIEGEIQPNLGPIKIVKILPKNRG